MRGSVRFREQSTGSLTLPFPAAAAFRLHSCVVAVPAAPVRDSSDDVFDDFSFSFSYSYSYTYEPWYDEDSSDDGE